MTTLHLVFPTPPPELSPNARKDYHVKASIAAQYKEQCRKIAHSYRVVNTGAYPLKPPVLAEWTFVLPNRRRRDYLNLYASVKNAEDALTAAGLISDDNVWVYTPSLRVELGKAPEIRLTLRTEE